MSTPSSEDPGVVGLWRLSRLETLAPGSGAGGDRRISEAVPAAPSDAASSSAPLLCQSDLVKITCYFEDGGGKLAVMRWRRKDDLGAVRRSRHMKNSDVGCRAIGQQVSMGFPWTAVLKCFDAEVAARSVRGQLETLRATLTLGWASSL